MSEENQKEISLYDFFYINHEKIGSYLSQLENAGKLTSIKHTSGQNSSEGSDVSVGLKGLIGATGKDQQQFTEGVEKTFDASQSVPLCAIEALHNNGYINTNILEVNYGQIVLIKGSIKLFDLGMFNTLWEEMIKEHVKNENRAKGVIPKDKGLPIEFKLTAKVLEAMPPFISLKTKSIDEGYTAWSTLEHRYVVGNPFDFSLKHSSSIRGVWYVLGVIDAKPNDNEDEEYNKDDMMDNFSLMTSAIRELAGRKDHEYGVTPIAIWRIVE